MTKAEGTKILLKVQFPLSQKYNSILFIHD